MRPALDFSFVRPDPAELERIGHDALSYTGGVRPPQDYLDELRARGVAFTFIQETYHERAQEGYNAGVLDAQFADKRADERNYPRDAAVYYAVSDKNRGDPNWNGDKIAAYSRGIGDATTRPYFGVYGNRYACDAARAGSPKCLWSWVPVTWDADPSRDVLIQEANTAPPIAGTDLNSVHAEFYGQWGAAPESTQENDMLIRNVDTGERRAIAGFDWFTYRAIGTMPESAFVPVSQDEWDFTFNRLDASRAAATTPCGDTGQGGGPTAEQQAAVDRAVAVLSQNGSEESQTAAELSAAFH